MGDMEDAVQQELGALLEPKVEDSSFSITETPEQKLNYILTGETTVEPDPNKVLKFTNRHLTKGYVRAKGLGVLYRYDNAKKKGVSVCVRAHARAREREEGEFILGSEHILTPLSRYRFLSFSQGHPSDCSQSHSLWSLAEGARGHFARRVRHCGRGA